MAKILLLAPPPPPRDGLYKDIITNHFTLALVHLAGTLREAGHNVAIYDSHYHKGIDFTDILNYHSDADWFGISIGASNLFKSAETIAGKIKHHIPSARIVVGGIHPTLFPEEVLECPHIDVVVVGEGEMTLLELISKGTPESVAGTVYRSEKGQVIQNPHRKVVKNLDALSLPAYDMIDLSNCRLTTGAYKRLPAVMLNTSRGCPFRCRFCANPITNKLVRYKSADKIISELRLLRNLGVKEVFFTDDSFLSQPDAESLCDGMLQQNLDILWSCWTNAINVDTKLLLKMKRSGCHTIMLGIESGDPEILKKMRKPVNLRIALELFEKISMAGIETRGSFIIGFPSETLESIERTIQFALKAELDYATFNIAVPYPGTELHEWAAKNGRILDNDLRNYTGQKPVIKIDGFTAEEISHQLKRCHREFYFRPAYIWRRLKRLRSINDLKPLFKGLQSLLKA